MPAQPLPIIKDGVIGDVPINFYPAADSEFGVLLQPTPGLLAHCNLTNCTEIRGLHTFPPYLYAVARRGSQSAAFRVNTNGTFSEIGTIPTSASGPVYIEHSTNQMAICDGVTIYVYTPATGSFGVVTDTDFPGAGTISAQDGYLLFTFLNSREWGISNLNDFTDYLATDYFTKLGKPDNVVAVKSLLREPWIMGSESIEVWSNVGGSGVTTGTFQRNAGGLLEYGLGAAASAALVNSKMQWLSDKRQMLQAIAYQPKVISNQMMEKAIGKFSSFNDAVAFSYTDDTHVFYVLTFPTGDQTWVWDDTTQLLHKRQSYVDGSQDLNGRWRGNCYALYENEHYVGDYTNGIVYKMASGYLDDNGEEIRREFYMQEIVAPTWTNFPQIEIGVQSGVGLISGLDPQIMLQFSADQGNTWTNEVWRSAGLIGQYNRKAVWEQMGAGYRRMYRAVMTDPVFWQIQYVQHGI